MRNSNKLFCSEKLSLRKVKSGAVKPFFLTFVHQPPGQDVRLKLMGQRHFAEVGWQHSAPDVAAQRFVFKWQDMLLPKHHAFK